MNLNMRVFTSLIDIHESTNTKCIVLTSGCSSYMYVCMYAYTYRYMCFNNYSNALVQ
jgi:hypothetical protein